MDPAAISDLKTVVTEACMNVVVHAYPDDAGPLEVDAEPLDDVMRIRIVDRGVGFQPRPDVDSPGSSLRIGLSLVATLSRNFSINGSSEGGTEVTIDMPLVHPGPPPHVHGDVEVEPAVKEVKISASDAKLLEGVLSRAVSAFVLRRDLGVDQVTDAILLADTVSHSSSAVFGNRELTFALADGDGGIDLTVGPLGAGGGERLRRGLELPDEIGTVETLVDGVEVESRDDGEYVAFRIAPR